MAADRSRRVPGTAWSSPHKAAGPSPVGPRSPYLRCAARCAGGRKVSQADAQRCVHTSRRQRLTVPPPERPPVKHRAARVLARSTENGGSLIGGHRQPDDDLRAAGRWTADRNLAVVRLDQAFGGWQAETGAARLGGEERREDLRANVGGDARAAIDEGNPAR